ncbi:MMPL family transporter [Natrialbaceae archaeon AArc-T1-2]|uniref:MMPL family transporter n=1 Tax=Natrialbaceae archaeon AArc-T1-2 TaxID=3053904 RepID=UPI00255AE9D1|nr:MMPL family transporter [Natrialbaceae archaeon AArc-T1-2]WIV68473.1 MMPL family transporter [Natrialbaceae archaeon AArc-T1-2]
MVVFSLVLGSGTVLLDEEASLEQFEADLEEAEEYDEAQERFGVEANETATQIVVRDDDALSRESLLETLAFRQDLRKNETVNESLVDEDPFQGLSEIVATASVQEDEAEFVEEQFEDLENESEELEADVETTVGLLDESLELQEAYEENELAYELDRIDEAVYEFERDRLEEEAEEIERRAQDVLDDDEYEAFEELLVEATEIQGELFRLGVSYEFDGISEAEFQRRTAELGAQLEGIYEAVETEVFADAIAAIEAERTALEERSERAVELITETRDLQETYEENELAFETGQIDATTYEAERERLEGEFAAIDAEARETLSDEEYAVFAGLLEETREVESELFWVGVQFERGQIDEAEYQQRAAELGAQLEGIYEAVETEVFAETIAAIEAERAALEERSERAVELITETRDLQEAYVENELAFEFDEIDEETYEAERERLESEFAAIDEEARETLTDEEYAAFAELLEETREVESELIEVGFRAQFDPVSEAEFEQRTDELSDDLEEIFEDVEDEVFADRIETVEQWADDLEERAEEEIPDIELTLEEQIDELESMTQSEVDDVVEDLLDEDAQRELFLFVPDDFHPGSTTTDARMLFVSQQTEEPEAVAFDADDEIVDRQIALAELADERFGDDALVFGGGILADETDRSIEDSLGLVMPLAALFVVIVLAIAYRDLLDILLGMAGIGLVLVWTFGFMGWAGIAFNQVMIVVPVLLIGLSIDYSIHVFMRHREQRERATGADERTPSGAMSVVLVVLGIAFVWVTTTAAIGFLANVVNPIEPIQEFGVASAFGIVSAFAIFGALVPAVKVELDAVLERRGIDRRKSAFGTGGGRLSGVLALGQRASDQSPWLIVILAVFLTAGGVVGAAQIDTTFDDEDFIAEDPPEWTQELPEPMAVGEYETCESLSYVDERFFRLDQRTHVVVDGNVTQNDTLERVYETEVLADELETTHTLPNNDPHVTSPLSEMAAVAAENETFYETFTDADTTDDGIPDDDLEEVYDEFVEADEDRAAEVLDWTEEGDDREYEGLLILVSVHGEADTDQIAEDGETLEFVMDGDGLEATATGQPIVFGAIEDDVFQAVFESLLVSMAGVFLVLMVAYRWRYGSASLGAITLSPIVLSVTWILGTMHLLSIPFNIVTGTITSLTIGLGVAYNIHMTERFMIERKREESLQDALYRSVTGTGGALFGSAGTTALGFGMLVFSILAVLEQFAVIIALTIAYAFLGSVFVLPSFLVLWNRHRENLGRTEITTLIGGRDVLRDPVLVGLLIILPAYFVGVWVAIVPDEELLLEVAASGGTEVVEPTFDELMGAVVAPVTGALVAGISALFLVQRSWSVDARLLVVGFRRLEVLAARFGVLSAVVAVVVAVSTATLAIHFVPEHPGWFVLALVLAAGVYGAIGAVAGTFLGRMAGVYLMLFAPLIDIFVLQFPLADPPSWASWLPGHHAMELALSAAFASDVAIGHANWAVGYLGLAVAIAAIAYTARQ